jgi:hypothetical protein
MYESGAAVARTSIISTIIIIVATATIPAGTADEVERRWEGSIQQQQQ